VSSSVRNDGGGGKLKRLRHTARDQGEKGKKALPTKSFGRAARKTGGEGNGLSPHRWVGKESDGNATRKGKMALQVRQEGDIQQNSPGGDDGGKMNQRTYSSAGIQKETDRSKEKHPFRKGNCLKPALGDGHYRKKKKEWVCEKRTKE